MHVAPSQSAPLDIELAVSVDDALETSAYCSVSPGSKVGLYNGDGDCNCFQSLLLRLPFRMSSP